MLRRSSSGIFEAVNIYGDFFSANEVQILLLKAPMATKRLLAEGDLALPCHLVLDKTIFQRVTKMGVGDIFLVPARLPDPDESNDCAYMAKVN